MYHFHRETFEGFEINVYALPEDSDPAETFAYSEDDMNRETVQMIHRGDLAWFTAKVTASRNGIELAADYLGCCCYTSESEFVELAGDYYHDMRATVVREARDAIAKLASA